MNTPTTASLEVKLARFDEAIALRLRQREIIESEIADFRRRRDYVLQLLGRPTSSADPAPPAPPNPPNHGLIGNVDTFPSYKFAKPVLTPSRHTSQLRCLQFLSINQSQFVTCADDSYVRKWQLSFPSQRPPVVKELLSVKAELQSYPPEAIAINPLDDSLVAVYGKLNKFQTVSLNQEIPEGESRYREIPDSPHLRGICRVAFMPQHEDNNLVLVTAGCQHWVATWNCLDGQWESQSKYKLHTNTITDICFIPARSFIMTSSKDKFVVGYDCEAGKLASKLKVDVACLGIASNPSDPNVLCIQTGLEAAQLRLYDMREKEQVRALGWMNTSEVSTKHLESAIMSPAWSSDGFMLSAGSAEKEIRVYDIRYSVARNPTHVIRGHGKRVFKVAWDPVKPVLMSISMDRNIGLHRLI